EATRQRASDSASRTQVARHALSKSGRMVYVAASTERVAARVTKKLALAVSSASSPCFLLFSASTVPRLPRKLCQSRFNLLQLRVELGESRVCQPFLDDAQRFLIPPCQRGVIGRRRLREQIVR